MEYLEYFKLGSEPFSNAPMSRFYYGSHQHSEALRRLQYVASSMKGLAICVGDIGHGKTTLARRMLDSLPESQYEAAMLVIVHAGITANWLLKRIASQLGVEEPADDKLAILSQLYNRLLEIHAEGKRAVVLIDEAQMLGTRELMEEFRGLLNLEVPEHKLITFIFFGLPELESNLRLDPPLAQRIALRYHLKPLTVADTTAYIQHRLRVAGASESLFPPELMPDIHGLTRGVPRLINTLCDNLLLEMYFSRRSQADRQMVAEVGENLGLPEDPDAPLPLEPPRVDDRPAVEGSVGHDAIAVVDRAALAEAVAATQPAAPPVPDPVAVEPEPLSAASATDDGMDPAMIAAQVAGEPLAASAEPPAEDEVPAYDGPMEPVTQPAPGLASPRAAQPDIADPLSYLSDAPPREEELEPSATEEQSLDYLDIEVVEEGSSLGLESPEPLPEFGGDGGASVPETFTPPSPQPVATTPPPSLALPFDTPADSEPEEEALPSFEAESTLEPSASTRGVPEVELSADELEVEPDDGELEVEAEIDAEPVAEAGGPSTRDVSFEYQATTEYRLSDFQMGAEPTGDIQVSQVDAPEPASEAAPAEPGAEAESEPPKARTVRTSTGSTIDLNEIDSLLADINSTIGRK